ncbi:AAA family ATPase [Pedobacter sp. HMF7647]|uniref:AAA family ATPase n=1 Tax=Hufsiella arboris TaxID=2695275 RepID=A0A7K1YAU6_9SPHI|nr:AAA family ATPase [Hufsiella arboris]MXV51229.1 AAA family ATPase [Hufsiella arboris]
MSNIKKYAINGLFNTQNVVIPFDENIKILIGENGLGKTTILNSLYYVLTKKWHKLIKIPFESIELTFDSNSIIRFSKKHLEAYLMDDKRQRKRGHLQIISQLKSLIPNVNKLKEELLKPDTVNQQTIINHQDIINYIIKNRINQQIGAPTGVLVDCLIRLLTDEFVLVFDDINKIIEEQLDTTIMYFPTYRRVEEELQNLGQLRKISNDDFDFSDPFEEEERIELSNIEEETLIQFGMQDVETRIKSVLFQISEMSLTGFTTVTGQVLSQMLKGFPTVDESSLLHLNKDDIEIILNRVRGNLSETDRRNIIGIVESKKLSDKKDLVFFLSKLIGVYETQKELDNRIKNFVAVCNKYLVGKELKFDESSVSIDIIRKKSGQMVKLNQLSSGEKQIVSLFSKIYLEEHSSITVLFDEPELSLSIEWQKLLLPDILSSGKCKFLLAVTHSPFIFKNELDKYAVGMNIFID